MPSGSDGGRLEFEFTSSRSSRPTRSAPDAPFRMLVIGDFSGRASRGVTQPLADRQPIAIDVDRFDAVVGRLAVNLSLPAGDGAQIVVPIRKFDSFHPDHLVANVDLVRALRTLRMALNNPATFEAAAAQVQALIGLPAPLSPAQTPAPTVAPNGASDLDLLLGKSGSQPIAKPQPPKFDINTLIGNIVKDHIVSGPDPRQKELTGLIDQAIFGQLGSILHNPIFQRVESAWRGVQMLVSRLNLDDTLKLFVFDASRDELVADLAREDISQSSLYKLLVDQTVHTAGAHRWAVLAVDEYFGPSRDDAALLARLATIAQQAGAALVAGATAEMMGCPGVDVAADPDRWTLAVDRTWWTKLRGMAVAEHIALAWPRILMRLPYGKSNETTEIGFEEGDGRLPHEQYLWGNPAYACLYALGQNFLENGWEMRAGGFVAIDDLPMHSFSEHGEVQVQAPAEAYLTDRASANIASAGIIPVLSIKNMNAASFAGFSSIADPPAALAGPWA